MIPFTFFAFFLIIKKYLQLTGI